MCLFVQLHWLMLPIINRSSLPSKAKKRIWRNYVSILYNTSVITHNKKSTPDYHATCSLTYSCVLFYQHHVGTLKQYTCARLIIEGVNDDDFHSFTPLEPADVASSVENWHDFNLMTAVSGECDASSLWLTDLPYFFSKRTGRSLFKLQTSFFAFWSTLNSECYTFWLP